MRTRIIGNQLHFSGIGGLLLAAVLFSPNLLAQSQCSAAMDTDTDPDTLAQPLLFTGYPDFAEIVRITLSPGAGGTSANLTVGQVDYALACADNGDVVPCTNGNDVGESSGVLPIEYVGNVDGTCGVTDSNVTTGDLGAGTVRFQFPEALTFEAGQGCTVAFDVRVRDVGTDASPQTLTGAAQATGDCFGGKLQGTGRGSVSIELLDAPPPPPPPPPLSVPGPQGWWLALMALIMLLPAAIRIGRS